MARKSKFKAKVKKYTILFLISGIIWCPLTMRWTLLNPDRAIVYGIKLAIVGSRVNRQVSRVTKKIMPKPITRFYDRWLRDVWCLNKEILESVKPKPKPSLFVRVGTGLLSGIKKVFIFII